MLMNCNLEQFLGLYSYGSGSSLIIQILLPIWVDKGAKKNFHSLAGYCVVFQFVGKIALSKVAPKIKAYFHFSHERFEIH